MNESLDNIEIVCSKHASKPDPGHVKAAQERPQAYVGHFVKKAFPATRRDGSKTLEHMWVHVLEIKDGNLVGHLDNDPMIADGDIKCGSTVTVKPEEIEEYLP